MFKWFLGTCCRKIAFLIWYLSQPPLKKRKGWKGERPAREPAAAQSRWLLNAEINSFLMHGTFAYVSNWWRRWFSCEICDTVVSCSPSMGRKPALERRLLSPQYYRRHRRIYFRIQGRASFVLFHDLSAIQRSLIKTHPPAVGGRPLAPPLKLVSDRGPYLWCLKVGDANGLSTPPI